MGGYICFNEMILVILRCDLGIDLKANYYNKLLDSTLFQIVAQGFSAALLDVSWKFSGVPRGGLGGSLQRQQICVLKT